MTNFRIGQGYDVHQFANERPCIIGGVTFDHPQGLAGHSDADVLLHAICDAFLGAINAGDIGDHFPPGDPAWKNADSKKLLTACYDMVKAKGFALGNLDSTIICEAPKIKKRRAEIRQVIAGLLGVEEDVISIKATTEEKMGFTGREEGIKAWATVLIKKA